MKVINGEEDNVVFARLLKDVINHYPNIIAVDDEPFDLERIKKTVFLLMDDTIACAAQSN
jgi:hypothetical protein